MKPNSSSPMKTYCNGLANEKLAAGVVAQLAKRQCDQILE